MGFLAPWFLLLGGAALVPLLIHLLRRRIGLQVEFPAARYLARAERDHSRTMRMRNLLLMLLRVLAVLLIAAAAARPTASIAGAGHAPTALAIVLDNSLSTSVVESGTSLLDQFKQGARDVLQAATADDRLWLITADGALRGGTAAALLDEIDRVRPYPGAGSLREAVARGVAAVEASGLPARQVAVITDGQRSTWTEPVQVRGGTRVLVHAPMQTPPVNRSVIAADPRPVRWTPRGALTARVQSPDSTTYRMALGARTLSRGTVAAGEEATVRAAPAERGWVSGSIEIEPDELVLDNARHFALWIGAPPAVRVLPGAGAFVTNAVEVLRTSERVTAGSGVVVAAADEATSRPALLLPPLDAVRIGAANRNLERLGIPWRFGAPRRESVIARGDHMQGVAVTARYPLLARGVPDADTLAVIGSEPWIVSGPGYVIVGSALDPSATSLPVSAAFLPWLGEMLAARLHAEPGTVRAAVPGERVPRPTGVDAIEGTDGRRIPVSGSTIEAPSAAGTYFLIQGARRVGALVVNPEPAESRLDRWSASDLREHVATSGVRVVDDRAEWSRLAFTGAARRSLLAPLLILILLLLAAEMAAATIGGRVRA
ncbi:MAG TPA: BatA and WFA domain-containing protein [Gemmatimonadaceae bacterium]|nr:BatA and WFA domain-containing protein [Gemmatimonadaceae bacterium]